MTENQKDPRATDNQKGNQNQGKDQSAAGKNSNNSSASVPGRKEEEETETDETEEVGEEGGNTEQRKTPVGEQNRSNDKQGQGGTNNQDPTGSGKKASGS